MPRKPTTLLSRRDFFLRSGAAAICALPATRSSALQSVPASPAPPRILDPASLKRYVDLLPIPPIAHPAGTRPSPHNSAEKLPFYQLKMAEFEARVHRDLPPARLWGFNGASPGPTIDVRSGQGILVEWANALPPHHLFPIDYNLHGAERDKPEVRAVVHVHGAKVPPESDGYPDDWYVSGHSRIYHYPNRQDACLLWYHDHAMGINRLNIYAGLIGLWIVRDDPETALSLPSGDREIPLVLCDRKFSGDGQLSYEVSPVPDAPWIPEFYGNVTLANGRLFPYLEVDPALYRFRVLNGSNAQFFNLSLSNGQPIAQIGTDQGLLPAPVLAKIVMVAPGERVDLIIDFTHLAGRQIILKTGPVEDILQFRVRSGSSSTIALPAKLRPVAPIPESAAVRTRLLTLNEYKSPKGESMTMLLGGAHWDMPITEKPLLDSVEIWTLINLTEDVHPIHLHLVRFQILDRRPFDKFHYFVKGELRYTGPPIPPDPGEAGWKDTVRADAELVTRIIVRFEGHTGRYVWHCHILEHEDNEMMRPYEVLSAKEMPA